MVNSTLPQILFCHRRALRPQLLTTAVRYQSNKEKESSWASDEAIRQIKEQSNTVFRQFFSNPAIEEYANKQSVRLTPTIMLYSGRKVDNNYLIVSLELG